MQRVRIIVIYAWRYEEVGFIFEEGELLCDHIIWLTRARVLSHHHMTYISYYSSLRRRWIARRSWWPYAAQRADSSRRLALSLYQQSGYIWALYAPCCSDYMIIYIRHMSQCIENTYEGDSIVIMSQSQRFTTNWANTATHYRAVSWSYTLTIYLYIA